jgi:D-sedoheptulose 7-phosphate isomerase
MNILNNLQDYAKRIKTNLENINLIELEKTCDILTNCYVNQINEVFICGNGGSLTMSEHFHCDHGKGIYFDTNIKPKIQPLTSSAMVTAIANDIGYDSVFSFQLEFKSKKNDILIAISASGNSPNIIKAVQKAKELEMITIAFTGFDGGKVKNLADINLWINDNNYGIIEDCHQALMHIISQNIRMNYNINKGIKL